MNWKTPKCYSPYTRTVLESRAGNTQSRGDTPKERRRNFGNKIFKTKKIWSKLGQKKTASDKTRITLKTQNKYTKNRRRTIKHTCVAHQDESKTASCAKKQGGDNDQEGGLGPLRTPVVPPLPKWSIRPIWALLDFAFFIPYDPLCFCFRRFSEISRFFCFPSFYFISGFLWFLRFVRFVRFLISFQVCCFFAYL